MSAERSRVRSELGPYSIGPRWVIASDISDFAYRLYHHLQQYADYATGQCWPLRTTLAQNLHKSINTIDAGLAELKRIGAIRIEKESNGFGKPQSNLYTVVLIDPSTTPEKSGLVKKSSENATTPKKLGSSPTPENRVSPTPENGVHRSKGLNEIQYERSTPLPPRTAGGTSARRLTRAERKDADSDKQEAHREHLRAERAAHLQHEREGTQQREQEARAVIATLAAPIRKALMTMAATELEAYPQLRDDDDKVEWAAVNVVLERARGRTIGDAVADIVPHRQADSRR